MAVHLRHSGAWDSAHWNSGPDATAAYLEITAGNSVENESKLRSISKPFYALPKAKLDSFTISANLTECILKRKITKIVFFSILVLNDCSAIFLEKNKDKLAVFLTNKQ